MMPRNRWDPIKVLQALQDNMNKLFEKSLLRQMSGANVSEGGSWKPVVDIYEDENEYVINAELPGLTDKDVEIKIEKNTLILKGARNFTYDVKEENYHRLERIYGDFRRDFALTNSVDVEKIEATFKNGLLKILLPKIEESKPKKIEISAG